MVANLVGLAGSGGVFPGPEEVAALGADRLREVARWGYRAEYLDALACGIVAGEIDPEAWERSEASTEAIAAEVRGLAGFGPYASAHVLALLGRYDRIGVDTVFRDFVGRRHFSRARTPPTDRRMLAVYDSWGEWTYTDYADKASRLATALGDLGLSKGDRAVLMMRNRPEFHIADLAVMLCGATPVSVYNSSAPEQIEYLVGHSKGKIAI
ncbi:MAG: AMP-binding protein, partial [Gemmatimonadetes bacterium]|nr:AMP-binding protein [Gemmatimonadota bacterium]